MPRKPAHAGPRKRSCTQASRRKNRSVRNEATKEGFGLKENCAHTHKGVRSLWGEAVGKNRLWFLPLPTLVNAFLVFTKVVCGRVCAFISAGDV